MDTPRTVSPELLSVSRRTDIPAFFGEKFVADLHAGRTSVPDPYGRPPRTVLFDRVLGAVFWSKNPAPLLPHLAAVNRIIPAWYFQFTLNDYPGLEPAVPPLAERIATFRTLVDGWGCGRVVWRFDPLVAAECCGTEALLERIARIGEQLAGFTDTLVFSFLQTADYRHVRSSLARHGFPVRDWTPEERRQLAAALAGLAAGWGMRAEACALPDDFTQFGIQPARCIDDRRLLRLAPDHAALLACLRQPPDRLLPETEAEAHTRLKDPHQRRHCTCIRAVDIGSYGTCGHGCVYCYAMR